MLNLNTVKIGGLAALALLAVSTATLASAGDPTSMGVHSETVISTEVVETISSGIFSGRSDHITSGGVSVIKVGTGYQLVFADDFSLDGAPDPIVGFGNDGVFVQATKISALTNKTGAQTYQLPTDFTPGQFADVFVFCEKFGVPLGVATLN